MAAYYQLSTQDERDNNYVTMRDNLEGLFPSVYQSYIPFFCLACRLPKTKEIFEHTAQFEAGPRIRVKTGREFAHSGEGFLLVKDRVLQLLKKHGVLGFASRPLLQTDWHVLRITSTVPFKKFKPTYDKLLPGCKVCGYRPYYGVADALHQLGVPSKANTFFTPEFERPQGQDIYLTEDVALMLKANLVKGAELHRVLSEDEDKLARTSPEARRKIKNRFIFL